VRSPATLRLHTDLGRLAEVRAFVRQAARGRGADETLVADLVQAVDEWVTNIVVHGYRGAGGPVEVVVERSGDAIEASIRDEAPAFDPATAPAFDPDLPLERRRFGGMGIHLIRDLAERFEHRDLLGGGNEVTIRVAARKTGGDR
jgi:serine/threonine-protein kinase RsbW